MISILVAAAIAPAAPAADSRPPQWADCTIIELRSDGSRHVTPPQRPSSAPTASANGSNSASSSSAASSASATSANGQRRAVTQTRDSRGCTVTVDERP